MAILLGIKRYETRPWKPYPGVDQFVLHAGLGTDLAAQIYLKMNVANWPDIDNMTRGAALGIARIIAVHKVEDIRDDISDLERAIGILATPGNSK